MLNGLGAIYRFKKPDVNMCLPPLVWQTYDIQFTAPRWASDGTKLREAHITSWVNGVKVQDNVALPTKTGHGKEESPTLEPIKLQDHKNEVRFRNVWVIDRGLVTVEFPVAGQVGGSEQVTDDSAEAEEVAPAVDGSLSEESVETAE